MTPVEQVQARIACLQVAIQMHKLPSHSADDVVKSATVLYNFVATDANPAPVGRKAKDKSGRPDPMS